MSVTTDRPAPYAPTSTILDVITRYRERGLPTPVTKDVLLRAGVAETLIPRVLQSLQTLDLIDDGGQPTTVFEGIRLAPGAEYQQRLAEWLNAAYADALNFVNPATADEDGVRDAFRKYNPVGQQGRMVSLFVGLYSAAGVRTAEKATTPRAPTIRARATGTATGAAKVTARGTTTRVPTSKNNTSSDMPPALAGLMASLPKDGDGWTQADRDKFLRTFGTVVDFCFPVVTQDALDAESEGADE